MHRRPRSAFTLIELLVVIAVIAVIAALLFPVFARTREAARKTACLSNQKQIAAAVLMYISDYDETFPFVLDYAGNDILRPNQGDNGRWPVVPGVTGQEPRFQLVNVVAPYVRNPSVWYCPSVGPDYVWRAEVKIGAWKAGARMRDQGTSYTYTYNAFSRDGSRNTLMAGKSYAFLPDASRWPMLVDEPDGWGFTGNMADPPLDAAPHFGGLNVAYGDGHARYHHLETTDGISYLAFHAGDGLYPGQ